MFSILSYLLLLSALTASGLGIPTPHCRLKQGLTATAYETVNSASLSISAVTLYSTGSSHSQPTFGTPPSQSQTTSPRPSVTPNHPSSTSPLSNDTVFDGDEYIVAGVGSFKNKKEFVFDSHTLPDGLRASDYTVQDTENGMPYNHKFDPANVYCDGQFLNLKVPASSNLSPGDTISCAEVVTTENKIIYASVRMNVALSDVPGTCHGMFFYLDDTQECDIEYLTDPTSLSNNDGDKIPLWLSNQALISGEEATQGTDSAPQNVTATHEYRIDWVKDYTAFYLDGKLMRKYNTNVPNKAGSWIWNNWSNGDQGWSVGPPAQDNIMRIRTITMYYNTDEDTESG